jgi:hypothetical protein
MSYFVLAKKNFSVPMVPAIIKDLKEVCELLRTFAQAIKGINDSLITIPPVLDWLSTDLTITDEKYIY